jgi:integrase
MASIHPTKHGTYEVKWRENGCQKSESEKTKREAVALKVAVERRLEGGGVVVRSKDAPKLEQFSAEWLAARRDLEDSTRANYQAWLEVHILPILGSFSIADLRPRLLQEWQDTRLAEGAGPAVLGKAQALLSQILNKAVLPYEYLDVNPVAALDPPTYEKRQHRWLTAADVEALRSWFIAQDDIGSATLISVLAYVGIRPQDALALSWPDVGQRLSVTKKNSNGAIKPGSKTGQGYKRTVYLPEPVAADLAEWRALHEGALIFNRNVDGGPWTKIDWDNWRSRFRRDKSRGHCFKKAAIEVGLGETLRPYDLRHTGASLYAATGWGAPEIAHQLGHSPTESQRTYQHVLLADGAAPRRSIEDYIREARGFAPAEYVRDSFGVEAP